MNTERKFTREFIISMRIADDINQWLHEKGDQIDKYQEFINRVVEIRLVVVEAMKKAEEFMEKHKGKGLDF